VRYRTMRDLKPNPRTEVIAMQKRSTNYRGYEIQGSVNDRGWLVEVHPRGVEFPILRQGTFQVGHPSWNAAVAEACGRVDAVLSNETAFRLPSSLEEIFEATWNVIGSSQRVIKSRPHVQRQLRLTLARCIVGLAANGTTDPDELRRKAIERIVLDEGVGSSGCSSLID
jgi:hypothetical protein